MADHSKPVLTSTYTNFVTELDARFDDLAVGLDPALTTVSNIPTGTIRWNSALNKDQKWNGAAWVDKTVTEVFPNLSTPGTITSSVTTGTAPLVITSTTKVANLNVDQLDGADWAVPAAIGSTTPNSAVFTSVNATSVTSGSISGTSGNVGDLSLSQISKSVHSGAIVKSIIYDTSKDSDGGAWRKRCADKSWYTEALGFTGTWGGQAANVAAGWAACGSVTGGAYQNTTDGKFYSPTSSTTQTEIFRGNVREFPEQVAIVAESARVVIYDLTQIGCPMWMVFMAAEGGSIYVIGLSTLAAMNGSLVLGNSSAIGYLTTVVFPADYTKLQTGNGILYNKRRVSDRNNQSAVASFGSEPAIVNRQVNDVAITTLENSPIDPATGLPVPTIFVGTAGGLSTITNSGTVTNSTSTVSVTKCAADGKKLTTVRSDGVVSTWSDTTTTAVAPDATYTASSTPAVLGTVTAVA